MFDNIDFYYPIKPQPQAERLDEVRRFRREWIRLLDGKVPWEGESHARLETSKPREVGLQISYSVHSEVSSKGDLREVTIKDRDDTARIK